MRIALISEGPSARDTWRGAMGYEHVVGVNGVPTRIKCTWWAVCDPHVYALYRPDLIGTPRIFTHELLLQYMNERRCDDERVYELFEQDTAAKRILYEEDTPPMPPLGIHLRLRAAGRLKGRPRICSAGGLAGLGACWYIPEDESRQKVVDVYGVDLEGTDDIANGADVADLPGLDRSPERWQSERLKWECMVLGLTRTGRMAVAHMRKEALECAR